MQKTIRELAEELGISVQAIHNHKKRHPELAEHMTKQGKTWLIDDVGQSIIRSNTLIRRETGAVDTSVYEELEQLKQDKIDLLVRIAQLEQQRADAAEKLATIVSTKLLLEKTEQAYELLQTEHENLKTERAELRDENTVLKNENDRYRPTIFGLYRKI